MLSYARRYWRKALKRGTKTSEALRLIDVMAHNPRKSRSKKDDTNSSPSDESLALDDEVEFLTEIHAPNPEVIPVGDADDDDIFILEIHAPVGAYSCNLACSPHPRGSRL